VNLKIFVVFVDLFYGFSLQQIEFFKEQNISFSQKKNKKRKK